MVGFCEHGNEQLGFVKRSFLFLDHLSERCHVPKIHPTPSGTTVYEELLVNRLITAAIGDGSRAFTPWEAANRENRSSKCYWLLNGVLTARTIYHNLPKMSSNSVTFSSSNTLRGWQTNLAISNRKSLLSGP